MNKNWWFLFEKVKNYQYFATNIFLSEKCAKFWHFRPKNWKGWSHNLKTFHEENLGVVKKNLENEKIMAAALHCEFWYLKYTNICQYFSKHGSGRHIFELCFFIWHSTRPPNLLQSYCNDGWLWLLVLVCKILNFLYRRLKVKVNQNIHPNTLSEIIII